jgi:hypothetical protein
VEFVGYGACVETCREFEGGQSPASGRIVNPKALIDGSTVEDQTATISSKLGCSAVAVGRIEFGSESKGK